MSNSGCNAEGEEEEAIVLELYLHCQNCSESVVKCLKQFPGVGQVIIDVANQRVTVKGKGVDPKSIAQRLENKCNKRVLSIISPTKPEQVCNHVNVVGKAVTAMKDEVKDIHVLLDVYIHCQNCGNNLKDRLLKMKGVRTVQVDTEKSQVKVEGVFEANKLVEYLDHKMGKKASIIIPTFTPQDTPKPKPKRVKRQTKVVDDDDGPKIFYTTSNYCRELFPTPECDRFLYATQLFSDEHSQQYCSIM